ncbi:hypothetical protein [Candidatus Uabimicrobium amorphum]|uniref:hypothetical protein n=1 Tax=Uabimicrobium amorphum TaxID=2596890 RepID=UPI00125FD631|nr:hypothetical protein [Candidatus Uabimicrobium amorphum]
MKILKKTITTTLESGVFYNGCAIYTSEQSVLENTKFENCSFRNSIAMKQVSQCEFTNCHFRELQVGIMQNTQFYGGYIDFFDLHKGKVDYLVVNTTIQRLRIYQVYEFLLSNVDTLRVNIIGRITPANVRGLVSVLYDNLDHRTAKVKIYTKFSEQLMSLEAFLDVYEFYKERERDIDFVVDE